MSLHSHRSYLAFDLGASSCRVVLGTYTNSVMHLDELHRFDTPVIDDGEHILWDLDRLWHELQIGLQLGLAAAPNLRSLSVDSWAVDYVRLDESGTRIGNPYCYRDARTNGVMTKALDLLPAEKIYDRTGIQFLPFNTLYQVLADKPETASAAAVVLTEPARTTAGTSPALHLTIADYFNYRFSGHPAIEVSMASTTQMMDVHTRQWSRVIFQTFRIDVNEWPQIVPSGHILGPSIQAPNATVIASCSHDTGCAVAAVPADVGSRDWAYISCGTWSLLGIDRRTPLVTDAAREAGFTNEAGNDSSIRFLKNLSGLWTLQECVREWRKAGSVDWSALEAEARASVLPGALINLDDPLFVARGDMEERIVRYCLEYSLPVPTCRGDFVLLILSSLAESYRKTIIDLEQLTDMTIEKIHLIGGGSKNSLLCQLTSDACAVPVVAGPAEATSLGNLLIQARAMGDLSRDERIRDIARRSSQLTVYHPRSMS